MNFKTPLLTLLREVEEKRLVHLQPHHETHVQQALARLIQRFVHPLAEHSVQAVVVDWARQRILVRGELLLLKAKASTSTTTHDRRTSEREACSRSSLSLELGRKSFGGLPRTGAGRIGGLEPPAASRRGDSSSPKHHRSTRRGKSRKKLLPSPPSAGVHESPCSPPSLFPPCRLQRDAHKPPRTNPARWTSPTLIPIDSTAWLRSKMSRKRREGRPGVAAPCR